MKTPLYDRHKMLGAKIVDFCGWELPIGYKSGIRHEHNNVRTNVGIFDVSHMGEIFFKGNKALELLDYLTTNNISKLEIGMAQYSLITDEKGGILDDVIVYRLKDSYMVCTNAINKDKILKWVLKHNNDTLIEDKSDYYAQIALQGPKSIKLAEDVLGENLTDLKPFRFIKLDELLVARTGYTGENGVEVFAPSTEIINVWDKCIEFGAEPSGLGARDTLRLEMKYPLYGNDINEDINPIEAGLGFAVKLNGGSFIGKDALIDVKSYGLTRKFVGFVVEGGIPRKGYELFSLDEEKIGVVTSGTFSPSLSIPIGVGYVLEHFSGEDTIVYCKIRNSFKKAKVVKTPFVTVKK